MRMKKEIEKELKEKFPTIKEKVLLKNYSTFRIGGLAKYFFEARKKEELIEIVLFSLKNKIPFFILGEGSNVLFQDKGFKGIIIKIEIKDLKIIKKNLKAEIFAGAGVSLSLLVGKSLKNNLSGLEWAIGIPGSLGGAIYCSAGAFGKGIKDVIKSVEVLEIFKNRKIKIKNFKNKDCKFAYRDSIFKHNKNLIILSAVLELKEARKREIKETINKYLGYRIKTQPLNYFSAGSVFKNPKGVAAAKLIQESGLKGKRIGDIKISEKHANFILNLGNGKSKDVKKIIDIIKKEVKKKFKVDLEEEIEILK